MPPASQVRCGQDTTSLPVEDRRRFHICSVASDEANEEPALWYWSREARSSAAEVDYLGAPTSHVLPIEAKAGTGGAMRSLHVFMADRKLAWAARFNSAAPMVQVIDTKAATGKPVRYSLLSLPTYAVECLPRLAREMDAESRGA